MKHKKLWIIKNIWNGLNKYFTQQQVYLTIQLYLIAYLLDVLHEIKMYVICSKILDTKQTDWLRNSAWNSLHDNIILIHGYAGGEDTLPIVVLKDGKLHFLNSFQGLFK